MRKINYNSLVAKTFEGLEQILADEIRELGGENIEIVRRAVKFSGTQELIYRLNLHLRTALRVLVNVHQFHVNSEQRLYQKVQDINWIDIISPDMTFAIDSVVNDSPVFRHSNFASLRAKDAIVDQIRDAVGIRPNVDAENPDVRINLLISGDECIISLDTSGESLHRRGYRVAGGKAPLNEVLAAALIKITGWDGTTPFFNPMCGSSTILIEAAMIAGNIAPGRRRKFGFMNWKNFDRNLWKTIRQEARAKRREIEVPIYGCDIDEKQIRISFKNIEEARFDEDIAVYKKDFFTMLNKQKKSPTIVINPPYDLRLNEQDIFNLYADLGDTLKQRYLNCDAWIITANFEAVKYIGLHTNEKHRVYNGQLECTYRKYSIFENTEKEDELVDLYDEIDE